MIYAHEWNPGGSWALGFLLAFREREREERKCMCTSVCVTCQRKIKLYLLECKHDMLWVPDWHFLSRQLEIEALRPPESCHQKTFQCLLFLFFFSFTITIDDEMWTNTWHKNIKYIQNQNSLYCHCTAIKRECYSLCISRKSTQYITNESIKSIYFIFLLLVHFISASYYICTQTTYRTWKEERKPSGDSFCPSRYTVVGLIIQYRKTRGPFPPQTPTWWAGFLHDSALKSSINIVFLHCTIEHIHTLF